MTEPTDAEIIALADETRTAEGGASGYILPISFARAVLAKWGTPPAVAGEPVAWVAADTLINSPHPTCISSLAYMSQFDRDRGREYVPLYAAPVAAQVPKHLLYRLRKHADDDRNSAFTRSTMREALQYLEAAQAPALPDDFLPSVKRLIIAARTTGGTAGRDEGLCTAMARVEHMLDAIGDPDWQAQANQCVGAQAKEGT